jgi:hypothetical protein
MKIYFSLLVVLGAFAFLILFLIDREREAIIERLNEWRAPHSEASDSDPTGGLAARKGAVGSKDE